MNNYFLGGIIVLLIILILLLWRLNDALQSRTQEASRLQEERLDRLNLNLDQKLAGSLGAVNARLEEVHRGLGSMESMAAGVGDLKKVLTNVKNRGIWGEMQLGNLLRDMLSPEQYGINVSIKPKSLERVEYALRLPGTKDETVWLPLDAKFPQEDYQRLLVARERGKEEEAGVALKQLEIRFKGEAKDIRDKYICPPYSTDFAVMYLPLEGLFAEAVNIPGLLAELQAKYRVTVAGPTTLGALINSLNMGFKTLAIQRQTSEVWRLFAQLEKDFIAYETALEKTAGKIEDAGKALETAQQRARLLNKKLEKAGEMARLWDKEQ